MLVGLESTKPGAMQLTVMPNGPSSCAVWRVKPIWPALALAYAWIPVRLTLRPAPDEMFTMRPYRRSFIPGATARVQRNVDFRFASTTACQSASETSSSGRPTWPTTPPALLTRMSTLPIDATKSATWRSAVASTVSRAQPCTVAPCSVSAAAIALPMPCAVPVTIATRPRRSGTGPAVRDQVAHLLDARLPHAQHVLVRSLVQASERSVTEQLARLRRVELAHARDVRHRLAPLRLLDAGEPCPRKVLEPGRMRRVGIDGVHDLPHARPGPPVVPDRLDVVAVLHSVVAGVV